MSVHNPTHIYAIQPHKILGHVRSNWHIPPAHA